MSRKLSVFVRTSFEAIHCWPDCPHEEVAYLRNPHRHVFHVEVHVSVNHDDRDVEFLTLKKVLDHFLDNTVRGKDLGVTSCEMLCSLIYSRLRHEYIVLKVIVSEDNENGAILEIS